jgi:hypothetical protein
MAEIEFIRINGDTVRVTSLRRDSAKGVIELVVVARGTTAGQQLSALGQLPSLQIGLPDEPEATYRVAAFDQRASGEGERIVYRVKFTLAHETNGSISPVTDETQLDRIERKLDEVLRLLRANPS